MLILQRGERVRTPTARAKLGSTTDTLRTTVTLRLKRRRSHPGGSSFAIPRERIPTTACVFFFFFSLFYTRPYESVGDPETAATQFNPFHRSNLRYMET